MSPVNPIFALLVFAAAFGTAALLARMGVLRRQSERLSTIDGLRGYLALGVFSHHAVIWYYYINQGQWVAPPSRLYTLLGQGSVGLFFLISAFLFTTKLLESDQNPVDWIRLYTSRVLRLSPLYLASMLMLFAYVAIQSGFELRQPPLTILKELIKWIGFTILGEPQINQQADTSQMMAGVTWSLPYEWLLYAALPLLAVLLRRRTPIWAVLGSMGMVWVMYTHAAFATIRLELFLGGISAAFAVRAPWLRIIANTQTASLVAVSSMAIAFLGTSTAYQPLVIGLLTLPFIIFACGNSLFGLLLHPASRLLGEISYSLYLLQGFIFYAAFTWITPAISVSNDNVLAHWTVVLAVTPLFVALCVMSFSLIEAPAMRHTGALTAWLKGLGQKRVVTA
jgi:peptidoglycan/LPS O-acetylase OafA/YrhL